MINDLGFYLRLAIGRRENSLWIATLASICAIIPLLRPAPVVADQEMLAPAPGMFLVAAPKMRDPRFRRTVVLLVEHSADGSLGVIINRRTDLPVTEAFPELEPNKDARHVLFFGGPVEPASVMYLFSDGKTITGQEVISGVQRGDSYENLVKLLQNRNEDSLRIYFGYAGWGPGQLEFELSLDDWQLVPASPDHVFSQDTQHLWHLLNRRTPGVMAQTESTRMISCVWEDSGSANPGSAGSTL